MKLLLFSVLLLNASNVPAQIQRYEARYDAKDDGVIIRHGDGANGSDKNGMREPSIVQEDGKFYLFYDGCADTGWLACVATSDDLKTWEKHPPLLSLGPPGSDDAGTASSPWVHKQGDTWYMFHVISANRTPPPEAVPMGPYLTGMATAKSLMGPWTQHRDYIPFGQTPGTPTTHGAYPGAIIQHNGEYMMFINGGQAIARTKDLSKPWTVDAKQQLTLPMENSSIYYEPTNQTWWMFLNHIRMTPVPHTDATYVFWTKDPNHWEDRNHAVVIDGKNSNWSKTVIGMATVTPVGNRLAIIYDGNYSNGHQHMGRDLGLAWLDLPLTPEKIKLVALQPSEEDSLEELGNWVWTPTENYVGTVRFRGELEIPAGAKLKNARLTITADDSFTVWLNGEKIGNGDSWAQVRQFNVAGKLRDGKNFLAVEVTNAGGAGGLIAGLVAQSEDGKSITAGTSESWTCSTQTDDSTWTQMDFKGAWAPVKVLGDATMQPWEIRSPKNELLPEFLARNIPPPPVRGANLLLDGGFEKGKSHWKVTGGDRIAYDWFRFPRDRWMGDHYFWLNGPNGTAEQITSETVQSGKTYSLQAQVGYSSDIAEGNMAWPGGRLVLVAEGANGIDEIAALDLPEFSDAEAGTFKPVILKWTATPAELGRKIGVRLESKAPQIAWDNIRLEMLE